MDEAGKMNPGNNIATNGHNNSQSTKQIDSGTRVAQQVETGTRGPQQVEETRSPAPMDIHESPAYDVHVQNNEAPDGTSAPSIHSNYGATRSTSTSTRSCSTSSTRERSKPIEPPVTKNTLSELDVHKIVNNPKLRHDINHDPDLHFRPNLDGDKGRKKSLKANGFWDRLTAQLEQYLTNRKQFEKDIGNSDWCLPSILRAIRDILETLVPPRDYAAIEDAFNVDLLMQQFGRGVADLGKLASWLSRLLKCHCAPMRDNWIDEMVRQLTDGERDGDFRMLVLGMKNLLAVLEAMKLDVANHQIRCLRPLLIDDTVHFEQKFFMKKIESRRMDIAGAQAFFREAGSLPEILPAGAAVSPRSNTWDFFKGLVNLLMPSNLETIPHTFLFDEDRLKKLRSDLLDLINLEICMRLYRNLEMQSRAQESRFYASDETQMVRSFASSPIHRPASPEDSLTMLSSPTIPSPHHFSLSHPKPIPSRERGYALRQLPERQGWVPSVDDLLIISAAGSPRLSRSNSSTPDEFIPTPLYLFQPLTETVSNVRSALNALLSSHPSADKWDILMPALAIQILRSTTTPLSRLPQFERHLALHLKDQTSSIYQEAERLVTTQLFGVLQQIVEKYTRFTSFQMFEAATSNKTTPGHSQGLDEELSEIATRIAHIGLLHWRVWAPLAYMVDTDAEEERDIEMQGDPCSR